VKLSDHYLFTIQPFWPKGMNWLSRKNEFEAITMQKNFLQEAAAEAKKLFSQKPLIISTHILVCIC